MTSDRYDEDPRDDLRTAQGDAAELPRSARREAEEARPDRTDGDLFNPTGRAVRRERAQQLQQRERQAGTGGTSAAAVPATGSDAGHGAVDTGKRTAGTAAGTPHAKPWRTPAGSDTAEPHGGADGERLIPREESEQWEERLQGALSHFVDGPRRSVEEAAVVLEEAARRLSTALTEHPRALRATWDGEAAGPGGTDGSDTERLRVALQHYRETTERLLRI